MNLRFWHKPKVNNEFHNIHHPIFSGQIEEAFKSNGVQYYRFQKEIVMPYGRYQMIQTYFLEYELRMDHKLFKQYISTLKGQLDGTQGSVNLGKAFETISKMEARAELAFAPDQAYNLASIIYFDETEDLYKYDLVHNRSKILRWKEAGDLAFLHEAIGRLTRLEKFLSTRFSRLYQGSGSNPNRPDLRHPLSIMQEFSDDHREQIKKLAKFDIEKEEQFKRMGVEEFMFHLLILSESKDE